MDGNSADDGTVAQHKADPDAPEEALATDPDSASTTGHAQSVEPDHPVAETDDLVRVREAVEACRELISLLYHDDRRRRWMALRTLAVIERTATTGRIDRSAVVAEVCLIWGRPRAEVAEVTAACVDALLISDHKTARRLNKLRARIADASSQEGWDFVKAKLIPHEAVLAAARRQ